MRDSLHIASLHHYPLKSAQGISLTQEQMNPSGLEQDRRWVLIDEAGKFLSQRACAAMGAIYVVAHAQQLTIHFHGQTHIAIANPEHLNAAIVWDDLVENCFAVQILSSKLTVFLGFWQLRGVRQMEKFILVKMRFCAMQSIRQDVRQ
jgi:uncharacterized protein YcbX